MSTFVLVHGAWAAGWMWNDVAQTLREGGDQVIAVDLPSAGRDPAALGGVADDVAVVTAAVESAGEPVVLVGHSYGGVPVSALARHPRVAHAVYLAAVWPAEVKSQLVV